MAFSYQEQKYEMFNFLRTTMMQLMDWRIEIIFSKLTTVWLLSFLLVLILILFVVVSL